jgi:hypothetical protein
MKPTSPIRYAASGDRVLRCAPRTSLTAGRRTLRSSLPCTDERFHMNAATDRAASHATLSRQPPTVIAEYRCEHCGRTATLRHTGLMHVVVPCIVAMCACVVAYRPPSAAIPWYSRSGLLLLAALMAVHISVALAIARLAKRFDRA